MTVLVEGEEEVGSPTLEAFLAEHRDLLAADVIVIADSGNWDIGEPALTTSLRGLVDCFVEVRTLDHGVHSGMWGGVVPDAVTAMVRLLATLHDDEGNVAVEGLVSGPAADVDYPMDRIRAESGITEGVELIGSGSVVERLWTKPSITTIGFDATRTADASNTLIPTVKAKLSVRLAPGDTLQAGDGAAPRAPREARPVGRAADLHPRRVRRAHPDRRRPGRRTTRRGPPSARPGTASSPWTWGSAARSRSSPPSTRRSPTPRVLVTGVEDPDTRAHGANEGLHLAEFERVCLAEALLLHHLAETTG